MCALRLRPPEVLSAGLSHRLGMEPQGLLSMSPPPCGLPKVQLRFQKAHVDRDRATDRWREGDGVGRNASRLTFQ